MRRGTAGEAAFRRKNRQFIFLKFMQKFACFPARRSIKYYLAQGANYLKGGAHMQAFFCVLNQVDQLEPILQEFAKQQLGSATVLDSKGMARILHSEEEMPIFYGLRSMVSPERRSSKTIFAVLSDEKVEIARRIVNQATGGVNQPDSGMMFAVPVTFAEGLDNK